ncbi:hypothetical protein J31TS4_13930 [Paenibacillus sp. J31TS4]|uniref:hypothetical protein n=1 Tax=Paenibacillus sp. J31TS4 TaxID=2807195 RepID=UPI001B1B221C|nr:hypothetical protein [Paenibacillus sp. J31TS4]GIP38113.1 hypothetical protein J31TS4_13930 [Paenibacillus sp. J31TS4]
MTIDDRLLDKLGDFYSSPYVAKNQPWVRQLPFSEWVEIWLRSAFRQEEDLDAWLEDQRSAAAPPDADPGDRSPRLLPAGGIQGLRHRSA